MQISIKKVQFILDILNDIEEKYGLLPDEEEFQAELMAELDAERDK